MPNGIEFAEALEDHQLAPGLGGLIAIDDHRVGGIRDHRDMVAEGEALGILGGDLGLEIGDRTDDLEDQDLAQGQGGLAKVKQNRREG
jgi:hypothetical protein